MTVYQIITDRIIQQLNQGKIPWTKPWIGGRPKNLITGANYQGLNVFMLESADFSNPYWLTFNQGRSLGATVKRGSKSELVIKYIPYYLPSEDKEEKEVIDTNRAGFLRYFNVFNASQFDNLKHERLEELENNQATIEPNGEMIVEKYTNKPEIKHEGNLAYYSPVNDFIQLPVIEDFKTTAGYYSTLYHEMIHSTGHKNRLGRFTDTTISAFGSEDYSKEELIAEMGSAFLSHFAGFTEEREVENKTAYIQSWLKVFKNDTSILISSASQAEKATRYITGE